MTLFPHYFSEEVVSSAVRRTQRPPRIVLRMFHPAYGENSGASLGGPVMRNGITGHAKRFSDLDIALDAGKEMDLSTLAELRNAFQESDLPMTVDLLDLQTVRLDFRKLIEANRVAL